MACSFPLVFAFRQDYFPAEIGYSATNPILGRARWASKLGFLYEAIVHLAE
jgi:hypothetical protein